MRGSASIVKLTKFGAWWAMNWPYLCQRARSSGRLGDKWHLDEAVISIRSQQHWLWRAVDQDGFVLEVLVQSSRDAKAAERLMRKLLKGHSERLRDSCEAVFQNQRIRITDRL